MIFLAKDIYRVFVPLLVTVFLVSCESSPDPEKLKGTSREPGISEGEKTFRKQQEWDRKYQAMTPEEKRIRREEREKLNVKWAAARPFYPLLDKFKTMDDKDVQEEIEVLFNRLDFAVKWGDDRKNEHFFEFCKEAFEKEDARTLWNMIKIAEKRKDWEYVAIKCFENKGGISRKTSKKILSRWAASVDVMEKPHLVFLLGWHPDREKIARELVESPKPRTWQKCHAMHLIAGRGTAEDIKFLEEQVGKYIVSDPAGWGNTTTDCGKDALREARWQPDRKQEKKTKP